MGMLVHLIYIHGFQGNDTSFQSFPNDLQEYLASHVPSHLDIKFQSSLYPTYKSVKPIAYAVKNFLEWLRTQPPGPVILVGHSMGGLLAADAATDPSNTFDRNGGSKRKRIFGIILFDTPFLGMHPHVVVSGIASLFPKNDDKKGAKSEEEMNPSPDVKVVDKEVTDDWESFKRNAKVRPKPNSLASGSSLSILNRTPSPSPISSPAYPDPPSPDWLSSSRSRTPSPFVNRAINFVTTQSNSRFGRWVKKHADDPIGAGKKFVVETFQFGGCMFDPSGLKERYSKLVDWDGLWINYWTQSPPRPGKEKKKDRDEEVADNDMALLQNGISGLDVSPAEPSQKELAAPSGHSGKDSGKDRKKHKKNRSDEDSKEKPGHHFSVLPTGLGQILGGSEKWEKVVIGGVQDEVAGHCGLFIRGQNLDYDGLVERVATKIFIWCDRL